MNGEGEGRSEAGGGSCRCFGLRGESSREEKKGGVVCACICV